MMARGRTFRGSVNPALLGAVLILFLVAGVFPAAAQDELSSARTGPYVGFSALGSIPLFEGRDIVTRPNELSAKTEGTYGLGARVGMRLHPVIAIEAQHEWMANFRVRVREQTCADIESHLLTGNVRVFVPFSALQPYALAGLGAGHYKTSVNPKVFTSSSGCTQNSDLKAGTNWELAVRLGGGFDIYITKSIVLNFEVSSVMSERQLLGDRFSYFSMGGGVQYRF